MCFPRYDSLTMQGSEKVLCPIRLLMGGGSVYIWATGCLGGHAIMIWSWKQGQQEDIETYCVPYTCWSF